MTVQHNYTNVMHASPNLERWGVTVSAAGFAHVPAGSSKPAYLDEQTGGQKVPWEKGRVLPALRFVLIPEGQGILEYKPGEVLTLKARSTFALLPGQWHRFRPDPKTGWSESWVELCGTVVEEILEKDFQGLRLLRESRIGSRIDFILELIHAKARTLTTSTPELSAYGMQILAFWITGQSEAAAELRITRIMNKAETMLSSRCTEPINMPEIANELGIAYSHFRREFKKRTGYSPWQYVLKMRLTRVCRLLLTSDMTLDQIATTVGFNSAYHLSSQFKKVYGLPPRLWEKMYSKSKIASAAEFSGNNLYIK